MKEAVVILGALAVLAYLLVQAFLTALQPLIVTLAGHVH